ncbi:MAG: hypothetical protein ACRDJH_23525 [Thermomicrobiales bacterium]
MDLRFSDVIDAALRDARTRATTPPFQPANGQGEDVANPGAGIEDDEVAAVAAQHGDPADPPPAYNQEVAVARSRAALGMEGST